MSTIWQRWLHKRDLYENSMTDPVDYDHVLTELFKAVMSKYGDETMDFLHQIASHGDQEIMTLLNSLENQKKPSQSGLPEHPEEKDEVVPSKADSGFSQDSI